MLDFYILSITGMTPKLRTAMYLLSQSFVLCCMYIFLTIPDCMSLLKDPSQRMVWFLEEVQAHLGHSTIPIVCFSLLFLYWGANMEGITPPAMMFIVFCDFTNIFFLIEL